MSKVRMVYAPDLMCRAFSAFRTATLKAGATVQQPGSSDYLQEVDGRRYAVLANAKGILAVYAVSANDRLRRIETWPKVLEAI